MITILVVYLVLLLLQSSICRSVNGAVMGGYWWMCGDVAGAQANSAASHNPLNQLLSGINNGPTQTAQNLRQMFQTVVARHEYFPRAGLRLPPAQAEYIFRRWCWTGVL
ncbi:MAG: hypothetical protein ABIP94_05210 [Planctomycetota bacterium]